MSIQHISRVEELERADFAIHWFGILSGLAERHKDMLSFAMAGDLDPDAFSITKIEIIGSVTACRRAFYDKIARIEDPHPIKKASELGDMRAAAVYLSNVLNDTISVVRAAAPKVNYQFVSPQPGPQVSVLRRNAPRTSPSRSRFPLFLRIYILIECILILAAIISTTLDPRSVGWPLAAIFGALPLLGVFLAKLSDRTKDQA